MEKQKKLNVAIAGYGNLGKALETLIMKDARLNLVAIFSRRNVAGLKSPFKNRIDEYANIFSYDGQIDILFVCFGSFNDIENEICRLAEKFNTIDSFDTHAKLKNYQLALDKTAKESEKVCLFSLGWDPGLLSLMRSGFYAFSNETLPLSFWGKGVSQGHTNAIKSIYGVKNAVQFTIPNKHQLWLAKKGSKNINPNKFHIRKCYICLKQGISKAAVKQKVLNLEYYFKGQKTKIKFCSNKKVEALSKRIFHEGKVFCSFDDGLLKSKFAFSLKTDSNPNLTAGIMLAGVNALSLILADEKYGAYSILDVPIACFVEENTDFDKFSFL